MRKVEYATNVLNYLLADFDKLKVAPFGCVKYHLPTTWLIHRECNEVAAFIAECSAKRPFLVLPIYWE